MRTLLIALCALAGLAQAVAAGEEPPAFTIVPLELSFGQRVDYVLGDGQRPFADEDSRRTVLSVGVRATVPLREGFARTITILGFAKLAIGEAVTEHDEALTVTSSVKEAVTTVHDRQADPLAPLAGLSLPVAKRTYRKLKRLAGSVEMVYADAEPASWKVDLADLALNKDLAIAGLPDATIGLTERTASTLVFRLNAPAYAAINDLLVAHRDGKPVPVRSRRLDARETQGRLSCAVNVTDDAVVEVRFFPHLERKTVEFALSDVDLGMSIPGREALRGAGVIGADGF